MAHTHRHMDDVAQAYEETIPAHVQAHYLNKRLAFIAKRLKQGTVLDVGCGTGLLARQLRATGFQSLGVDESFGMLKECLAQNRVACAHGDSARLPVQSGSIDAAICIAAMHHVVGATEIQNTLREMLRVVKPGGWILVWDHNPLNPYWPIFMKRLPQDQEETRLVPMGELVEALRGFGVSRIETHRLGLVPDFAPKWLLWFFQAAEWLVERLPGLNLFCAHNVVVAYKGVGPLH